jgi:hypothetical protein
MNFRELDGPGAKEKADVEETQLEVENEAGACGATGRDETGPAVAPGGQVTP